MCTEPLYAIRLKTEFDKKFQRFGTRTPIIVKCAVRDVGSDTSKIDYDKIHYDLIMISCGQCLQCRLQRVKQRAVMSICESLEHKSNLFITLTFGYPQTYAYYRHEKKLSHYLASKKAHFHEWSLDVETFQKFLKRLRNWYYNYQLCNHLISLGRLDLIPLTFFSTFYITHLRLPAVERPFLLKDFKPKKIRVLHCGEYGSKKNRPHHHLIAFGLDLPDLVSIYENGKQYFTSNIISKLWTFGIHRIGTCTYNSCAYVSRYVTKKVNGNNQQEYYSGRKPEYVTYSTKPVLGANYFLKNKDEIVNTQTLSVVADKKYECHMPKSYDNILKKIDVKKFNQMKEERVNNSVTNLERLLKSKRSIYAKLDSNQKICMSVLKKLVRSYEQSECINYDEFLKKAKSFGVNTHFFDDINSDNFKNAKDYLDKRSYRDHKSVSSNSDIHNKYYKFELARKRHISQCYNVNHSDERVVRDLCFYINMPNPFKVNKRGKTLPDTESVNELDYIDKNGRSMYYD